MRTRQLAAVALGTALVGCADVGGGADRGAEEGITAALAKAAQTGDTVHVADVVGGDWDRLTFICPYEDEAVVTQRLGFRWNGFPGADETEGTSVFVFSREEDVAIWTRLPRSVGDPCGVEGSTPLTMQRADAVFAVERNSSSAGGSSSSLRQTKQ